MAAPSDPSPRGAPDGPDRLAVSDTEELRLFTQRQSTFGVDWPI